MREAAGAPPACWLKMCARTPQRHCERSEAIHLAMRAASARWIASSQGLLAMTLKHRDLGPTGEPHASISILTGNFSAALRVTALSGAALTRRKKPREGSVIASML